MKILDRKSTVYPNNTRHKYWVLVQDDKLVLRHGIQLEDSAPDPSGTLYTLEQLNDPAVDTGSSSKESYMIIDSKRYLIATNVVYPSEDGNLSGDCTTIVWAVDANEKFKQSFNIYNFNKMYPGYQGSTPYSILKRITKYIFVLYRTNDQQSLLDGNWVLHSGSADIEIYTNLQFDQIINDDDTSDIKPEKQFVFNSTIVNPQLHEDNTITFNVQICNQIENVDVDTSIIVTPYTGVLMKNRPYIVTKGLSEPITIIRDSTDNTSILFDVNILYGTYLSSHKIDVI